MGQGKVKGYVSTCLEKFKFPITLFIFREFSARVANQETYLFCLRVMVSWPENLLSSSSTSLYHLKIC